MPEKAGCQGRFIDTAAGMPVTASGTLACRQVALSNTFMERPMNTDLVCLKSWKRGRMVLSAAALLALAACGGGGGGSSDGGSNGGGETTTATVSGVASKGLLRHAIIKAYEVNSDGTESSTVLATAETADNGSYTLTGIPSGKTVVLKITAGASTKMADEATGTDIDVPSNFILRAVQKLRTNNETVLVTPYSEMAASIAASNGGFTDDAVTAAVAQVKIFAGDKVFTDVPTFDDNNKPTNASAAALAAVSKLAADGGMTECASESNQSDKVKCVVEQMATKGTTDSDLADKLNQKLNAVTADVSYSGEAVAPISRSERVTINTEVKDAVQAAKSLIASVRNTIQAMSDKTSASSLVSRARVVGDAVQGSIAPMDRSTRAVIAAAMEAMAVMDDPASFTDIYDVSTGKVTLEGSLALGAGCQFYADAQFQSASVSPTDHLGCRVLHRVTPQGGALLAIQHRIQLTRTSADHYVVKTALIQQTGTLSGSGFVKDSNGPTALGGGAVTSFTADAIREAGTGPSLYNTMTVSGDLAPGVRNGAAIGTRQHVSVALSQAAVSDSTLTQMNLSGVFDVYDGATLVNTLGLQPGSYLRAVTNTQGDITGPSGTDVTGSTAHLVLAGTSSSGSHVTGTLNVTDPLPYTDANAGNVVWPTAVSFTGSVTEANGTTRLFDGSLTLSLPGNDSVSTLGWRITLQGTLVTSGTGTVAINLSLAESHTVLDLMSFTGSYVSGSDHITVAGGFTRGASSGGSLTLADAVSGVGFTFHDGDERVSILKGESLVGVFTRHNGRLVFADNSYEQF